MSLEISWLKNLKLVRIANNQMDWGIFMKLFLNGFIVVLFFVVLETNCLGATSSTISSPSMDSIVYSNTVVMTSPNTDSNQRRADFMVPILRTRPIVSATIYSSTSGDPFIVGGITINNLKDNLDSGVNHDSTQIVVIALNANQGQKSPLTYFCDVVVVEPSNKSSSSQHPPQPDPNPHQKPFPPTYTKVCRYDYFASDMTFSDNPGDHTIFSRSCSGMNPNSQYEACAVSPYGNINVENSGGMEIVVNNDQCAGHNWFCFGTGSFPNKDNKGIVDKNGIGVGAI